VCPAKLEIDSVSGDVSLRLPADSGFTLRFDSVSGCLQCDFSIVMKR
jgi:hypothetical protein